jgi:hypothetical protein
MDILVRHSQTPLHPPMIGRSICEGKRVRVDHRYQAQLPDSFAISFYRKQRESHTLPMSRASVEGIDARS